MELNIITPDTSLFSGKVSLVQVPGTNGSFEILRNHAPIISTLGKGRIKIKTDKKEIVHFNIESGLIEVLKNNIIILTETPEHKLIE